MLWWHKFLAEVNQNSSSVFEMQHVDGQAVGHKRRILCTSAYTVCFSHHVQKVQ